MGVGASERGNLAVNGGGGGTRGALGARWRRLVVGTRLLRSVRARPHWRADRLGHLADVGDALLPVPEDPAQPPDNG
ncbi:MAG: hypothetical protein M0Z93_02175, partial [Actinomycetota bacterium]|nr:hypothetical protein [Actinomycetota bacterium]